MGSINCHFTYFGAKIGGRVSKHDVFERLVLNNNAKKTFVKENTKI